MYTQNVEVKRTRRDQEILRPIYAFMLRLMHRKTLPSHKNSTSIKIDNNNGDIVAGVVIHRGQ